MKMQSVLFSLLLVAMAMPAAAQNRDSETRVDRRIEHLDEKLDLTNAQEAEIRRILTEHTAEMEPRRRKMREEMVAVDAAIKEVLTPEQREIYGETRDRRRGRAGARMHHMARMAEELNLSEDQQERLKALHEEHRETIEAWREAHPEATDEERKAYLKARREAMHESLQSVLTSDQLLKFSEMHKKQGGKHGRRHRRVP